MFNLITNEWIKIFKRPGTYVMIAFLLLATIGTSILMHHFETADGSDAWKTNIATQLKQDKDSLANDKDLNNGDKKVLESSIALNEYRLSHNIPDNYSNSLYSSISNGADLISLVALFVIIVGAGSVSQEFSWGTIKMLLIRPTTRVKVLTSKYVTVLLFALMLLVITYVVSGILGLILYGTGGNAAYLTYANGHVTEHNAGLHLIGQYLLGSVSLLIYATLAFMISAAFRNSSLAIGLSIFLLFAGSTFTAILSHYFSWTKYILFANTDLSQFQTGGMKMIESLTLPFSITVLAVYYIIFLAVAFYAFVKRDVAA